MNTITSNGTHSLVDGFITVPWSCHTKVFHMLRPEERAALFAKLRLLHDLPREEWEEKEAFPLQAPLQETYLVPFNDELSVFFTPQSDGTWRVEDVTSQEALDRAAKQLEQAERQ